MANGGGSAKLMPHTIFCALVIAPATSFDGTAGWFRRSGRHAAGAAAPAPRKLVQLGALVTGVGTEVGRGQLAHSCGKSHPVAAVAILLG